jgi:hypothetical protein
LKSCERLEHPVCSFEAGGGKKRDDGEEAGVILQPSLLNAIWRPDLAVRPASPRVIAHQKVKVLLHKHPRFSG